MTAVKSKDQVASGEQQSVDVFAAHKAALAMQRALVDQAMRTWVGWWTAPLAAFSQMMPPTIEQSRPRLTLVPLDEPKVPTGALEQAKLEQITSEPSKSEPARLRPARSETAKPVAAFNITELPAWSGKKSADAPVKVTAKAPAPARAEPAKSEPAKSAATKPQKVAPALNTPDLTKTVSANAVKAAAKPVAPQPVAPQPAKPAPASKAAEALSSKPVIVHAGAATPADDLDFDDRTVTPKAPAFIEKPKGKPDDLLAIKGIGPRLSQILNDLGIWTYAQIASWSREEMVWINAKIDFKGRVQREKWVQQARALARKG